MATLRPANAWPLATWLAAVWFAWLALTGTAPAVASQYAVLVASGAFPRNSAFARYRLDAPANDVTLIASLLEVRFGFPASHITVVGADRALGGLRCASPHATAAAMTRVMCELARRCRPGDEAVFYYSGHGAQVLDPQSPQLMKHVLVPYDADPELARAISEQWVHRWRARFRLGVRVTMIIDACYSEGFYTAPPLLTKPPLPWPNMNLDEFQDLVEGVQAKAIPNNAIRRGQRRWEKVLTRQARAAMPNTPSPAALFSASGSGQPCYELHLHTAGRPDFAVSLYTWVLYRTLTWASPAMTNQGLEQAIERQYRGLGQPTPHLDAPSTVLRRLAVATPLSPAAAFQAAGSIGSPVLDAGRIAGITANMIFRRADGSGGARLIVVDTGWMQSRSRFAGDRPTLPERVVFAGRAPHSRVAGKLP